VLKALGVRTSPRAISLVTPGGCCAIFWCGRPWACRQRYPGTANTKVGRLSAIAFARRPSPGLRH
jgi:hypothetical protein